jgi:predicted nucleic acid-binding protein
VWAYFDSSAVVKVYVQENGRATVLRLLRLHEVVVSAVLPVEIRGALRRRAEENAIESSRLSGALSQLAADREQWNVLAVSTEILARAEEIVANYAVRTLDAIHIASAKEFAERLQSRVPFISADHRQVVAAAAVGLTVQQIG